uniref:DOCKER domain-containing protein n=1 Tax=Neolamprologus brichardi TaxID=32507 RepID=A0A3Q4N9Z0_NEOBR
MYQHQTDLSPIEVAIDEMSAKVNELRQLCSASEVDMIRLQLKLQGSISVQVNAGPLAYARAFLDSSSAKKYPDNKFFHASLFRQFVDACGQALSVNERLIKEDQQEYHDEMKANYRNLTREYLITAKYFIYKVLFRVKNQDQLKTFKECNTT